MTVNYLIAPSPRLYFLDTAGKPLVNGYVYAYRSTKPDEKKSFYQDPSGSIDYPNPTRLDGVGSMPAPYWADDEKYYLRVHDQYDQLVFDYDDYPITGGSGSTPVTVEVDYQNYILNGQFRFMGQFPKVLSATDLLVDLGANWSFFRSNGSASVTLNRPTFLPGTPSSTIEANPKYYLQYVCSVAGSGETKSLFINRIADVRSFSEKTITVSLVAKSSTLSTISIIANQIFGSGGSPSTEVQTTLGTITLTNTLTKYSFTGIIPSIGGKNIGTNKDDLFEIAISLPVNIAATIDILNVQLNLGNKILPYQYITTNEEMGKIFSTLTLDRQDYWEEPDVLPIEDIQYTALTKTSWPRKWTDQGDLLYGQSSFAFMSNPPVGATAIWWTATPPEGYLMLLGQAVAKSFSPRLYNVLGDTYTSPTSDSNTTASVLADAVTVTMTANGSVSDVTDVDTGFSFAVTRQGDAVTPEQFQITCNDATTLDGGEYFVFQTPDGTNWAHVFIKDQNYDRIPSLPSYDLTWTHIKTGDTANDIASKVQKTFAPLTFNLPMPRGWGLRVTDYGFGNDPDRATRTARPDGVAGDNVGTIQGDMYKAHSHPFSWFYKHFGPPGSGTQGTVTSTYDSNYVSTESGNTSDSGGTETRMKNININLIIKY